MRGRPLRDLLFSGTLGTSQSRAGLEVEKHRAEEGRIWPWDTAEMKKVSIRDGRERAGWESSTDGMGGERTVEARESIPTKGPSCLTQGSFNRRIQIHWLVSLQSQNSLRLQKSYVIKFGVTCLTRLISIERGGDCSDVLPGVYSA